MAKSETKNPITTEPEKMLPLWVRHVMFGTTMAIVIAAVYYHAIFIR